MKVNNLFSDSELSTHGYIDLVMRPTDSEDAGVVFSTRGRVFQCQHFERYLKI